MRSPRSTQVRGAESGIFLVRVFTGSRWLYITKFRGKPSKVITMSYSDPFGPATAEIEFPAVTSFDKFGEGDLVWLRRWTPVEIIWSANTNLKWEGFITSIEVGSSVTVQCKGGLHVLDNFLAAPFYPTQPMPYEYLLNRGCAPTNSTRSNTHLKPMKIEWPEGWNVTVPRATDTPNYLWMLRPYGVKVGERWTGLATRSTGSWEPFLTGFMQTLLSTMYTPEGDQWTLMLDIGRQPVLRVREQVFLPLPDTLRAINGAPGVKVSLSQDWSQSANVIYGTGTDLSGLAFSKMDIDLQGYASTYYEPFAHSRYTHPVGKANPMWDPDIMRKEAHMTFAEGIDEFSAEAVARSHLQRFADPGWSGTISLEVDPVVEGVPFNRYLIQAGQTIVLEHWCGSNLMLHISQTQASPEEGTMVLTVDSRYRDALTVQEVQARTRDALDPKKLLQVGKSSTTINDLVLPWSYYDGSGYLPKPSKKMFDAGTRGFPWTDLTTRFPPKTHPGYYVKIDPARDKWNSKSRWSHMADGTGIPIRLSQAGNIMLSQVAAYDQDGNVLPVEFHISIYGNRGVTWSEMPYPMTEDVPLRPNNLLSLSTPLTKLPYSPFFEGAFEHFRPNGEKKDEGSENLGAGAEMIVGWGNYYEAAGYYPSNSSIEGAPKTGLMVDETPWSYSLDNTPDFQVYSIKETREAARLGNAGYAYAMIYCEDELAFANEVYFLGRFWVTPQT